MNAASAFSKEAGATAPKVHEVREVRENITAPSYALARANYCKVINYLDINMRLQNHGLHGLYGRVPFASIFLFMLFMPFSAPPPVNGWCALPSMTCFWRRCNVVAVIDELESFFHAKIKDPDPLSRNRMRGPTAR